MMSKQRKYERIYELRRDHDLTQAQAAAKLGLHTTQYRRYECAKVTIPADIIVDIAKLYHVRTDYIFGLTNKPR